MNILRICARCGNSFAARAADVARGWAKFCSKSCKAKAQEARTGHCCGLATLPKYDPQADQGWDEHKIWSE